MKEKYLASKTPLLYALLFVMNLGLFVLFELLAVYTLPQKLDCEALAKINPDQGQSKVLWTESSGNMTCHLIQHSDGSLELVTARRHDFSLNRFRLVDTQSIAAPTEGKSTTVQIRFGIHNVPVTVTGIHYGVEQEPEKQYSAYFIEPFYISHVGGRGLPVKYLAFAALLEFLELAAYTIVKRNL